MSWVPRVRDIPIHQIRSLREAFPQFAYSHMRGGGLTWRGTLRPTTESREYTIIILHQFDRVPSVRVSSPLIHPGAPHRYADGSLCLYWPIEWRWSPRALMADTLVPWTALWLYYYEIWLVTDHWLGPSSPHGDDPAKEAA